MCLFVWYSARSLRTYDADSDETSSADAVPVSSSIVSMYVPSYTTV